MALAYADAHGALVESLDARVREIVRKDGVDPQAEASLVRRIAEDAVRAHDERSLTGQVSPVPDPQAMVGELVARIAGFGPLQPYLDDPDVEELWINDPSQVFVARHGRHELTTTVLTSAQVAELGSTLNAPSRWIVLDSILTDPQSLVQERVAHLISCFLERLADDARVPLCPLRDAARGRLKVETWPLHQDGQ